VQDGGGELPTPDQVLWKYHGKPHSSRLHTVLDPELPEESALAMWPFLGAESETARHRELILDWVDRGAPEADWATVEPILAGGEYCGQCHTAGGQKEDASFDTYAGVLPFAQPDRGMSRGQLMITAHNHWFGFTVLALILSLGVCLTRLPSALRMLLILGVFGGAVLDVAGWLLTSAYGAPYHYVVMAGGGLFGATSALMALAILVDALRIRAG
jgi:hypothetical protein